MSGAYNARFEEPEEAPDEKDKKKGRKGKKENRGARQEDGNKSDE